MLESILNVKIFAKLKGTGHTAAWPSVAAEQVDFPYLAHLQDFSQ